jgi:hypothetical protein
MAQITPKYHLGFSQKGSEKMASEKLRSRFEEIGFFLGIFGGDFWTLGDLSRWVFRGQTWLCSIVWDNIGPL